MEDTSKTLKLVNEYIVLTLGSKPEVNFRKVAEKGIRVFISEYKENKETGLVESVLDTSENLDSAIRKDIERIFGVDDFYFEIIGMLDSYMNCDIGIRVPTRCLKLQTLVIIRQNNAAKLALNAEVKGSWAWLNIIRDDEGTPLEEELANKPDNPTLVISELCNSHMEEVMKAVEWVRHKLYFTNLVFSFLPESFTLKEFEEAFNTLNGHEATTIKKKWISKVEETGEMSNGLAHRPAKLYRLKV